MSALPDYAQIDDKLNTIDGISSLLHIVAVFVESDGVVDADALKVLIKDLAGTSDAIRSEIDKAQMKEFRETRLKEILHD